VYACVCITWKNKGILLSRTCMISTDNLYNPACTSTWAKMGSLSTVMSTDVILLEAVMPTSHSQGAAGITGGGAGWNSHICLSSTTYMESSINNPYYQLFAEHLHFQIPYVASKRVNLLKSGPICSFSGPETPPNSNASSVFRLLHRRTRAPSSASPSQLTPSYKFKDASGR